MSIESIVNQSLDLIGYKRHIGSIYDGSPAARIALDAWGETRDEVLALRPWPFARFYFPLAALTNPPPPWPYVYARPAAAIRVLDVIPSVIAEDERLLVSPIRWMELGAPERRLASSFSPASAVITYRTTDFAQWPPDFTAGMVQALAEKLQHGLVGGAQEKRDDAGRRSEQRA